MAALVVTNGLFSTNAYAAQIAFGEVGGFTQRPELVIPALVELLEGADLARRQGAASALRRLGPQGAGALPSVLKALEDKNEELRYQAARVLEEMGTNALPAIEALRRATNDSSVMVQRVSSRALEKLISDR